MKQVYESEKGYFVINCTQMAMEFNTDISMKCHSYIFKRGKLYEFTYSNYILSSGK